MLDQYIFLGTKHEHLNNKASRITEQSRISSGCTWRWTGVFDCESGRVGPHWLTTSMIFLYQTIHVLIIFLLSGPMHANKFEHLSTNNFYPCGGQHLISAQSWLLEIILKHYHRKPHRKPAKNINDPRSSLTPGGTCCSCARFNSCRAFAQSPKPRKALQTLL